MTLYVKTGAPTREWTETELRRMKGVVEAGEMMLEEVGRRFHCSRKTVVNLLNLHGWHNPHDKRGHKAKPSGGLTRGSISLAIQRARANQRQEAIDTLEQRMVESKCRRLTGAEFNRRAAELLAREAKASA